MKLYVYIIISGYALAYPEMIILIINLLLTIIIFINIIALQLLSRPSWSLVKSCCREPYCDAAHVHGGEEGLRREGFDQQVAIC